MSSISGNELVQSTISESTCQSSQVLTRTKQSKPAAPADIAALPGHPPVQPMMVFPATVIGVSSVASAMISINSTIGLSILEREMRHFAIHAVFLVQDLAGSEKPLQNMVSLIGSMQRARMT